MFSYRACCHCVRVVKLIVGLLCCAASGLEKGKEYEFRVKAKNRAGLGEPSQPSETVTPKAKASPYTCSFLFMVYFLPCIS